MINILSYVGINMQSEVCLWTLLGLMRTIFDATLFKVNANLKQVWQMSMPAEMSMPVQRVLRTMISGIMLVQCFTVYVYLASYIVLLYPVFLEERPTLVLPWLLLAAIRKLLCELTSLAMGLGACVLLGPAKPPCVRFLVFKIASIMPSFYKWILIYSYYNALKVATAYKTFPIVLPPAGLDYGLELAIRRRCTKSLFGEEQLRKKLEAGYYGEGPSININPLINPRPNMENTSRNASGSDVGNDEAPQDRDILRPLSTVSHKLPDVGAYEDWFGSEIMVPRDGDRILEQFVVMLLRIAAYLKNDGTESINSQMFNSALTATWATRENIEAMPADITDTPPLVGNMGHTASYLRNYPQIFMKKLGTETPQTDRKMIQTKNAEAATVKARLRTLSNKSNKSYNSNETTSLQSKRIVSDTIIHFSSKSSASQILQVNPNTKQEETVKTIISEHENVDSSSFVENVVENAANINTVSFDDTSQQSRNVGNIADEKFVVETKKLLEMQVNSKTEVLSEDIVLQNVEEMIEGCSKYIDDTTGMLKSKMEQIISVKIKESFKNIDSPLPATSNEESKVQENTNTENGTSGLTNTNLIANVVLNILDNTRNTDTSQPIDVEKEELNPNLKNDIISNKISVPQNEEMNKDSSKLDKSSIYSVQLLATSSLENKLLENTSTSENRAIDTNFAASSGLTSIDITEKIREGRSKYIDDTTGMLKSKMDQIISVEIKESFKNIDSPLPATSNEESKAQENTNTENGTPGLTNSNLIANVVLNILDNTRNTDTSEPIDVKNEELNPNLKNDIISNKISVTQNEEMNKVSSKLDKSSIHSGQLLATSSMENKLLENTSTSENRAIDTNFAASSGLTSIDITEKIREGRSKYIDDTTGMLKSNMDQIISVEMKESFKNIDSPLPATSNEESKVQENTNTENGTSGLTNPNLKANVVLNILDNTRNTDTSQPIDAKNEELNPNLKSDIISNKISVPQNEEMNKVSSKLDKSSIHSGQLLATSSMENRLLENTSTSENRAADTNFAASSGLTSIDITEKITTNLANNIKKSDSNKSLVNIVKTIRSSTSTVVPNEVLPKKEEIIQSSSKFIAISDARIQSKAEIAQPKSSVSSNNIDLDQQLTSNKAASELLDSNNNIKGEKSVDSVDNSIEDIDSKENILTNALDTVKNTDSYLLLDANDVKGVVNDKIDKEIVDRNSADTSRSANTSRTENKAPNAPDDEKI